MSRGVADDDANQHLIFFVVVRKSQELSKGKSDNIEAEVISTVSYWRGN